MIKMINKKNIIIIGIIIIISTVLASGCVSNTEEPTTKVNVTEISINPADYGEYKVQMNIVPNEDFQYLGLMVIYYDDKGTVLQKDTLLWNVLDAAKGQKYSVASSSFLNENDKPVKAELYLFDDASTFEPSNAIWNKTINL